MRRMILRDIGLTLAQAVCAAVLLGGLRIGVLFVSGALAMLTAAIISFFSGYFDLTMFLLTIFIAWTVFGACFCGTRALLRLLRMLQTWRHHPLLHENRQLMCLCLTTALLTAALVFTANFMLDAWMDANPWLFSLAALAAVQYIIDLRYYPKLFKRGDHYDPC